MPAVWPEQAVLIPPSNTHPTLLSEWAFVQMGVWFYFFYIWLLACMLSRSVMYSSLRPARLLCAWNSLVQMTGVSSHVLLQGVSLTHGSNEPTSAASADGFFTMVPPGKHMVASVAHYSYPAEGAKGSWYLVRVLLTRPCVWAWSCVCLEAGVLYYFLHEDTLGTYSSPADITYRIVVAFC